jgi:hypothetical protein
MDSITRKTCVNTENVKHADVHVSLFRSNPRSGDRYCGAGVGYLLSPENLHMLFLFLGGGGWGLNSGLPKKQVLYLLSHISSPVCSGYFEDGVS